MKKLALQSFQIKNFKAIQDSGEIKFTPLTVFIGGNGVGKSSLIEGLSVYQTILDQGLDAILKPPNSFEQIRNKATSHTNQSPRRLTPTEEVRQEGETRRRIRTYKQQTLESQSNPLEFSVLGNASLIGRFATTMAVTSAPSDTPIFIQHESVRLGRKEIYYRNDTGRVYLPTEPNGVWHSYYQLPQSNSMLSSYRIGDPSIKAIADQILGWQFGTLNPLSMGLPRARRQTAGITRLLGDGSNLAEYLLEIYENDPLAFNGLVETLKDILPYASDLRTAVMGDLNRSVYLELTEQSFKVPGWMLSSGTLRLVGLLALLRHPSPPPLIVIEEIENGLDPRTLHLLVEEIKYVVENGICQVVFTTHSPYLLDLLSLTHIVLVERVDGQVVFRRPTNEGQLAEWSRQFGPGKLYTMGKLKRGAV